jgi:hypothetical protein
MKFIRPKAKSFLSIYLVFYFLIFYFFTFPSGPYFNNVLLSLSPGFPTRLVVAFVPFDDAKVRRFFELAMDFTQLCAITAPFVDKNQRNMRNS